MNKKSGAGAAKKFAGSPALLFSHFLGLREAGEADQGVEVRRPRDEQEEGGDEAEGSTHKVDTAISIALSIINLVFNGSTTKVGTRDSI